MAILAVLKSGAAYVPLDPEYPVDRIQFVLEDSGVTLLIVAESVLGNVPGQQGIPTLVVDSYIQQPAPAAPSDFRSFPSSPSDLAYIIYTSGTTGRPKGVLIEHRGVANFATDPYLREEYGPGHRVYQAASVAFDGILVNTFRTLCAGGTLVIPTDNLLEDLRNVHVGAIITSFLSRLDPTSFPNLKTIAIGGEPLLPEQQARWTPHCVIANHYGPTEVTVYSNLAAIGPDDDVTIGRPIDNVYNLVVDDELQLVPVGAPGELLIGGVGVARGYQNLPALTANTFISNPHGEGRVYRTGDYVRWLSNGTVEFIGRIDNQIKLRGYRIEIEEIENTACQFPGLKQCVAVVVQETLVLYASPANLNPTSLLDFLRSRLSKQMVPELVVPIEDFTAASSGKLDRRSLPSISHLLSKNSLSSSDRDNINVPHSEIEEDLRQIWGQILQQDPDRISTTDHFFRIGGDSISAILLVSKGQQIGYKLSVPLIYQYPELRQLAQNIEKVANHQANGHSAYQAQIQGEVVLAPIQCWFSATGLLNPHHFNQSFTLNINPRATLSLAAISDALVALANHHDTLRARFQPNEANQSWVQTIPTVTADPTDFFLVEETVSSEDYADFILRVQSSLHLTTGPVLAAALIHDPVSTSRSRLFVTIHHILVDLIAWRILIEDLNTLFRGDPLPPKTLPFQSWTSQLGEYAATLSADIWPTQVDSKRTIPDIRALLPPPGLDGPCIQAARLSTFSKFDSESTQALLFQLAPQLRVTPHDLLLATFTHAFATTIGLDQVTFCMEGHGREPWLADQDITRTVGWFTALYPLVLRVEPDQSLLDLLRHTKESLQEIPMKGFPYSVLKHMPGVPAEERAKLQAKTPDRLDVQFNYFGRFNHSGGDLSDDILSIEWSDYFGLHDFAPQEKVVYDINPMPTVVGDCLRLVMEYNPLVYYRTIVDKIMGKWRENLVQLAGVINQPQFIGIEPLLTRHDFAHLQLSDSEFQETVAELRHRRIPLAEVEALLPCIALQGGLLTGLSTDKTAYLVQVAFKVNGPLNIDRLLKAWQEVSQQHTSLRTVFLESSSKHSRGFIQAVLGSCSTVWTISDQPLASLEEFLTQNRQRGFTLQEHMIRNFVFPTADSQVHDVIVTFHHSLCDGWSLSLLLHAWAEAYHYPNQTVSNPAATFTSIVHHVGQLHSESAQVFWGEFLQGALTTPAPLILLDHAGVSDWAEYVTQIDISKAELTRCSQARNVTVATLLRAAYALVLGRLLDQDDVVFGVTLSGRNLSVSGIDRTIGPCTNTLPFRVRLDRSSIFTWLQTLHLDLVAMIPFEHSVLTDIIRWTSTGQTGPLFQTLLGMENFPDLVADPTHDFTLSDMRIHEFTEYPLAVNYIDSPHVIKAKVFYNTSNYSEAAISQIIGMLQTILGQILSADTNTTVDQLSLVTPLSNRQITIVADRGNTTATVQPLSLVQVWDTILRDHTDLQAYISEVYSLSYGQVDMLADILAFQSGQTLGTPSASIVALVGSAEDLLVCLVSAIKMGAHLTLLAAPCTLTQLMLCIESTASQVVWLPSTKTNDIQSLLNGIAELITIPNAIDEHVNERLLLCQFNPSYDLQDLSLTFISQKNSDDPAWFTVNSQGIQRTLASTQSYISEIDHFIIDHSLALATPQAAWLILSCLFSHKTIITSDSSLGENTKSSTYHVVDVNCKCDGSLKGRTMVLCDLAQARWPESTNLIKPTDICISFFDTVFHGHQRATMEQLVSRSFLSVDKAPMNYSLDVVDGQGHTCPTGVVGHLAFSDTLGANKFSPTHHSVLGYQGNTGLVHMLGPASQRAVAKGQQVHLGLLNQALVEASALSPRSLILPDGQLVALVAGGSDEDLSRLEEDMAPPVIPLALVPHAIISTQVFPHVTDLAEHLLLPFAQAYLTALPLRYSKSMSETEWWLTVAVNELN
ncbi:hypothetical protein H4R33_006841, partial [Dimargaris cristalligena]